MNLLECIIIISSIFKGDRQIDFREAVEVEGCRKPIAYSYLLIRWKRLQISILQIFSVTMKVETGWDMGSFGMSSLLSGFSSVLTPPQYKKGGELEA